MAGLKLLPDSISKLCTHSKVVCISLQVFKNDLLRKCNIKQSDTCDFCKDEVDGNFHMLIDCHLIQALWEGVGFWISELGDEDYELTDQKILGAQQTKPL